MVLNRKAMLNRKGMTWQNIATIVIVIAVMLLILLVISGDARALVKSLLGMGPSDESIWKANCDSACDAAKMQVTDCLKNLADWKTLYCGQEYNDVLTCSQAEAEGTLSRCEYKTGDDPCFC